MFDELFDWLNDLPFEEQQLFLKAFEKLKGDYEEYKLLNRKSALEELKRVVISLKNDIDNNNQKVK